MTISGIPSGIKPILPLQPGAETPVSQGVKGSGSFSEMFHNALGEVNQLQGQADQKIKDLTLRHDDTTTHDAMIALEKADVAFQLMNQIRSKIIRAYEEVMRTQV